jgi:type IX secretion system PorP/SprF family membrane protein
MQNKYIINPAIAGSDGYTSVNITTRQQWTGLKGAPKMNSASFQTRFIKQKYSIKTRRSGNRVLRKKTDGKVGLGGYVYNYRSGLVQRTGFQASYVYHTWVQRKNQLSMSLGLSGYHFRINEEEIDFEIQEDPVLATELMRGIFVPDIVFGAYWLNERYALGFSADQLLGGELKLGSSGYDNYQMKRHFYLMGSYSFFFGKEIELRPSFLYKMSEELRPQLDFGLTYIFDNFKNAYWAGIAYRTENIIVCTIGVRADQLYFGYGFDYGLNQLQKLTYGTHEFSVAFQLGAPQKRFRWMNRY